MRARDRVERIVRGWHDSEAESGGDAVIDFDCAPEVTGDPVTGPIEALRRLDEVASSPDVDDVAPVVDAHTAFLRASLGERVPLSEYVRRTQGCPARGFSRDHVDEVFIAARGALDEVGVGWGANSKRDLDALSTPVAAGDAAEVIRKYAGEHENAVRDLTGASATYTLDVESVDLDAYWSYWIDGAGQRARLRINTRTASFTELDAYRFALHEVLGHALQYANLTVAARAEDASWPRHLAVHCPHQVLFEGLAQVLPLAVRAHDPLVRARVRLDHAVQLVNADLHLMINQGEPVDACAEHARARLPFWSDDNVASALRDRSLNPQLRSYLWAYPAGIDWFMAAHDAGGTVLRDVLHAGYRRPLVPVELEQLWPAGPRIGGDA